MINSKKGQHILAHVWRELELPIDTESSCIADIKELLPDLKLCRTKNDLRIQPVYCLINMENQGGRPKTM